jgi:uncharacterized protein (DUF2141 family)
MKKTLITIFLFACAIISTYAQGTLNVSVEVKGISETKGKIYASIVNVAAGFPSASNAFASKAIDVDSKELHFEFNKLIGETDYAIIIFQDLNDNGVLDMQGGRPAEPFGFSNYMMMGPPSWDVCSFNLENDKNITIQLYNF